MKRITIKDVAAHAGVSFSAVSRAFQEDGRVSNETRRKVLESARLLDYRPSPIARGLVHERSRLVTLVTGPTQSVFDALFFDALSTALADSGRQLMVVSVRGEHDVEAGLMQAVDYKSEAAIVSAGTMSLALSSRCSNAGLPVILSGRVLDAPGVRCILAENVEGGRQAGALLARLCPGPLAFFGRGGKTFADREREEGFLQGLAAAGRTAGSFIVSDAAAGSARESALQLLMQPDRPQGIFCSNDGLAIELLQAALLVGLRVPQDLSVVGFDNVPMADWPAFRLTTIDYPITALVEAIIAAIEATHDPEAPADGIHRVPTRLVVRRTTLVGEAGQP
ncbi:MAG TPA: LacI family DNA-binding transcriptional regulator [Devosiaceae bacterium]|jgi:DNA-binding LacI/PurR family transcriptional regulator